LAGATALIAWPTATPTADAASLNLNLPSCATVSLQDNGGGNYSILCGSTPVDGAPTGCSISRVTSPSPLNGAAASVTLNATCSGGTTANTTWSWTKNAAALGSGTSVNDALAANAGSTSVNYNYVMTACNGSACATASTAVAQPGTGNGGGGGDGPPVCEGFTRTTFVDLQWVNTSVVGRLLTSKYGSFGQNDALVIKFRVPDSHVTGGASFRMAEWGGGSVKRRATLSQTACDFTPSDARVNMWESITISASMGIGEPYQLRAGQTYYLNLKNLTCTTSSCNMFLDFMQW
jgi:hypothetical protein